MGKESSSSDMLLYILGFFVPPVPVYIKTGCGNWLLLNLILLIFGWIPAVIHAWYCIGKFTTPAGYNATTQYRYQ